MVRSIRLLLVDDHKVMREGLRALLEQRTGFEVVGEAGDGRTGYVLKEEAGEELCRAVHTARVTAST